MKKVFRFLVVLVCMLGVSFILGSFLKDTAKYAFYSWRLADTEQAAEKGVWTETGLVFWGPKITAQYEREKAEKAAFIESSGTANFLYHSAFSSTGKVIRVIAIWVALVGYGFIVYLLVITSKNFISYLRKYCKYLYLKKKRAHNCRHNRTR